VPGRRSDVERQTRVSVLDWLQLRAVAGGDDCVWHRPLVFSFPSGRVSLRASNAVVDLGPPLGPSGRWVRG
jgi:hypothetical protein